MAFRFRKFKVYQDSKKLHSKVVQATSKFPRGYWHLSDQTRRSSLSVVLNVAEGSSKRSDKDFNRYILNALGSVDETVAGIEVARDCKLISEAVFKEFEDKYEEVSKQLGGLSKKLRNS